MDPYNFSGGSWRGAPPLSPGMRVVLMLLQRHWRLAVLLLSLGVGLLVVASSVYTVQPSEEVVVTRLGAFNRTSLPGLHYKLPFGIESAVKVRSKLILQEEFGFRSQDPRGPGATVYHDEAYFKESQMLTGDLNVADVEWIVQYQISDAKKYLFRAANPHQNIRDVAETIMRRVVGDGTVNDVLTTGRVGIGVEAQHLMQEVLSHYDIGIRIVTVKLQDVNPPESVKASFNEVNAAKQEQEQAINNAEEAYNKIIPEARGKAEETISRAEGYASAAVTRARGDGERFTATLRSYRLAPDITRQRLYLETMEELFGRLQHLTLIDNEIKGLTPILGQLPAPVEAKR